MIAQHFRLHLTDDTTTDIRIMPADRMRAERASTEALAPSQRGPKARALHVETWLLLWCWCAARRLKVANAEALSFEAFAETITDYTRVDAEGNELDDDQDTDPEDDESLEPLDPTRPEASTG